MAKQSLEAYAHGQKMKDCPVCSLPMDVREQIRKAGKKRGIPRAVVLKWLNEVVGVKITATELTSHANGRHEQRREELGQGS